MRQKEPSRLASVCRWVIPAAAAVAVLLLLDAILYPCTFMRIDIHELAFKTFDDVYLGTSHGKMNIDPEAMEEITGRTGHNACVGGEYPIDSYYMTRLMIDRGHAPKRIVYEISGDYLVREKEEGNNYLLFFHEFPLGKTKLQYFLASLLKCNIRTLLFPGYEYDLSYEIPRIPQTAATRFSGDYSAAGMKTAAQEYHMSGFIERFPVDTTGMNADGIQAAQVSEILPENMEYLAKLISLCRDNGIEFTAVTTPLPLPLLQAGAQQYQEMWAFFEEVFAKEDVTWINFNDQEHFGAFTHEMPAFTDIDGHMNGDAARAFSRVLAQALEQTEKTGT